MFDQMKMYMLKKLGNSFAVMKNVYRCKQNGLGSDEWIHENIPVWQSGSLRVTGLFTASIKSRRPEACLKVLLKF